MAKKAFFREATKAEIKRKALVNVDGFIGVMNLKEGEYAVIPNFLRGDAEAARKFMKHGPEVKLSRCYSLEKAIENRLTPVQRREIAFNKIRGHEYCSYSDQPLRTTRDQRKRKIPLVECLEGARIFAHAHQSFGTFMRVKSYADAKRVRKEGADVVVSVPSRTKGERRQQFKFMSVPMIDSPEKYGISLNLGSDHTCPSKRFNIRYRYLEDKESSRVFNFCAHEVAGYFKLAEQEWNENKNIVPLQMCIFAIPTQETVDYYLKWGNNILIRDDSIKAVDGLRKPRKADKEIALWAWVQKYGHDRTFFAKQSVDGSVQDYNWRIGDES